MDRWGTIGGSDAPVIWLGELHDRTADDLACEKKGLAVSAPSGGDLERGTALESTVIEALRSDGHNVSSEQERVVCGVYSGHIDGVLDQAAVLEIKCPRMARVWEIRRNGLPTSYSCQVHQYMRLTGLDRAVVAVWSCDDWSYDCYDVEYDSQFDARLKSRCDEWWERCVIGSETWGEVFGTPVPDIVDTTVDAGDDLDFAISLYQAQRARTGMLLAEVKDNWPPGAKRVRWSGGTASARRTGRGLTITVREKK